MAQLPRAGATLYARSLNNPPLRPNGARNAPVTESAPTIVQHYHLDGVTIISASQIPHPVTEHARSEAFFGSQGGTVNHFPPRSVAEQFRALHSARVINDWVQNDDGPRPRLVRGIEPSEPSSSRPQPSIAKKTCDCCATARIIRELEQSMTVDLAKKPPTNDNNDHYFAGLSDSGSQYRHGTSA